MADMARTARRPWRSGSDIAFDILVTLILAAVFLLTAYPLYFVIIASVSDPAKVSAGTVGLWPIGLNSDGYRAVLSDKAMVRSFLNSVLYTTAGTLVNLVVTIPAAYALSRRDLRGRGIITAYFLIPMFITAFLVPTFIVVRTLGLYNTMWALILPVAVSVYNLIIARSFFESTLPPDLQEAAKIDGCGNTEYFLRVALPLSGAVVAILVLYYGVSHWNSYFTAMIYLNDARKFPFQLVLRSILTQSKVTAVAMDQSELLYKQQLSELMKYALIILSSIPVMVLYPFVQKHFVKGVMIGSLKG